MLQQQLNNMYYKGLSLSYKSLFLSLCVERERGLMKRMSFIGTERESDLLERFFISTNTAAEYSPLRLFLLYYSQA